MNDMSDDSSKEAAELPPATAPDNIPVSLRGFSDAAHAERFGQAIAHTVRAISRCLDLERLDGITVAFDYDDALAHLDRGFQASRPLTRTSGEQILGVAMAPSVMRDGIVKAHLVFWAPVVLPLEDETHSEFRRAIYLVAHECGHIQDLKHRDQAFPGVILQEQVTDTEKLLLDPVVAALWEEYAACRASAIFGEDHAGRLEEGFISVLAAARDRANAAIRAYRLHGDIDRLLEEAGRPLCEPLRLAAYLTGHLDGIGRDFDHVPQAHDLLAASPYSDFVQRLWDILRDLWSRRGDWASRAEFDPLKDLARDVLSHGGLVPRRLPDGALYVDVPFTAETMP